MPQAHVLGVGSWTSMSLLEELGFPSTLTIALPTLQLAVSMGRDHRRQAMETCVKTHRALVTASTLGPHMRDGPAYVGEDSYGLCKTCGKQGQWRGHPAHRKGLSC